VFYLLQYFEVIFRL